MEVDREARVHGLESSPPRHRDAWLNMSAYETPEQPSRIRLSGGSRGSFSPAAQELDSDNDGLRGDWHFSGGPSPIPTLGTEINGREPVDDGARAQAAHEFAQSHFRRRNRLETRLEELQKDVASLTLRLRSNSTTNRSMASIGSGHISFDKSTLAVDMPSPKAATRDTCGESRRTSAAASKKTPQSLEKTRRKMNMSNNSMASRRLVGSQPETVRALRELHTVTTERDQLKFELERMKRALTAAEKRAEDAQRAKKAYQKLKTHSDSLQESLDLSEKIRVRQKKLLQQMQKQQQQLRRTPRAPATRKTADAPRIHGNTPQAMRTAAAKKRSMGAGAGGSEQRTRRQALPTNSSTKASHPPTKAIPGQTHAEYDIFDSLAWPGHNEEERLDVGRQEQPASEPTAAARSQSARSSPRHPATSPDPPLIANPYRSDFDSLLQTAQPTTPPRFTTRRPNRITTKAGGRPSRAESQKREAMQQAAKWARSRGTAVGVSLSTVPRSTRSPANRPKNSFLAPTQASLRRLHEIPHRRNGDRPPFVP